MKYDEVALISLGINPTSSPDEEELIEALEESVYQESNYFLKRDFLPKLAEKRIRKMEPLCKLSIQLGITREEVDENESYTVAFSSQKLEALVSKYNELVSKLKLRITRSNSPCDIIEIYRDWKACFIEFAKAYCEVYEDVVGREMPEVKIRLSAINFVELREELQSDNYKQKAGELYSILKTHI